MGSKADPTRDRVVESQSIAEQLRAFRDEALHQLAEAGWPIDRLETLEDLERLSVWAGLTPTERDRMTMDEVCRHAMYVSERRQIERSHRIAEQAVVARKMRQWACQDATGDRGDTTISGTPQVTTGDVEQVAAGDGVDIIATSPSGRVQLLKPSVANTGGKSSKRPCYAIVDGGKIKLIETQFVALLHVLNELNRGYRPAMDELASIENEHGSCQDGYRILKRLAKKEPWKSVIDLPGEPGRGIGIH